MAEELAPRFGRRILRAFRFAGAVILAGATVPLAAAGPAAGVSFVDGKLSANLSSVTAGSAFQSIEEQAPIRIRAPQAIRDKALTVYFADRPIEDGMKLILRSLSVDSHAVIYDGASHGMTYVLLAPGSGGTVPSAIPAVASLASPKGNVPLQAAPVPAAPPRGPGKSRDAADENEELKAAKQERMSRRDRADRPGFQKRLERLEERRQRKAERGR